MKNILKKLQEKITSNSGCSAKTNCRERFCIAVPEGQFASNWFEDYTDKKQMKKNNRKLLAMQCCEAKRTVIFELHLAGC